MVNFYHSYSAETYLKITVMSAEILATTDPELPIDIIP